MSGSDIRDILQIGAPTEPVQRKVKPVEKRPGAIQLQSPPFPMLRDANRLFICRWHKSRIVQSDWRCTAGSLC